MSQLKNAANSQQMQCPVKLNVKNVDPDAIFFKDESKAISNM